MIRHFNGIPIEVKHSLNGLKAEVGVVRAINTANFRLTSLSQWPFTCGMLAIIHLSDNQVKFVCQVRWARHIVGRASKPFKIHFI